jgi:hypothetical protein
MQSTMVEMKRALTRIWFGASAVLLLLVLLLTVSGGGKEHATVLWSWFLPTVMPTLSLIVSVFVNDVRNPLSKAKKVDRFVFRLAVVLSVAYLALVALTLLIKPFWGISMRDALETSHLWLGPAQGLVVASLGAFFVKSEDS